MPATLEQTDAALRARMARDFGPCSLAHLNGWRNVAILGPHGGIFTVYILSLILGGICGGALYDVLIRPRREATA